MVTDFNILAWKISWIEKSGGLQLRGVERDWATNTLLSILSISSFSLSLRPSFLQGICHLSFLLQMAVEC